MLIMGCWRWFNSILKEAKIEVTDENKEEIERIIHEYISEQSSYGRCSSDWRKARKEIRENLKMREELVEKLRGIA